MLFIDKLRHLDEYITKNYPYLEYNGAINEYEDEMDYVNIEMKGAIIS